MKRPVFSPMVSHRVQGHCIRVPSVKLALSNIDSNS